ncbi:transcription initiation factor iia subunit 2 [Quercus suber]|uniref:Transcription initiation factor iia subunit 2 n=1 Tax=Quercus suber TaxID=58331 RepID=A0AAW0M6V3_QUESU
MASSKATSSTQVPRAYLFELVEGMQLRGSDFFVCADELWINWFIPVDHPSGTTPYMQGAMQTPFRKEYCRRENVPVLSMVLMDRFCDNVWTFILQDALFRSEDSQENVGRVKIVACDSKLLTQ